MRDYLTDTAYIATCRRFGITPSALDYDAYRCELASNEPDDDDGMDD